MTQELSLDVVHSQIPAKMRPIVDEGVVQEIQKLAENPDYGHEFLDMYMDHLNVLKDNPRRNHDQYMRAVKFFSLVESEHTLTDAYIKVFPERFKARTKNSRETDPDKKKQIMRGEASRYNGSQLLNEIRKAATIPVQLIHRHLLHEAILVNADIMNNSSSDMVRQKAADTLIRELKPAEDQVLKVEVEDGAKSAIQSLMEATEALADREYQAVHSGVPLKKIADRNIIEAESKEIPEEEAEYEPVPVPEKSSIPIPDIEDELTDVEDTDLGEEAGKRWKL